jgi:hypothetical protein
MYTNIDNIIENSYDKEIVYSHGAFGETTTYTNYVINSKKLGENILSECKAFLSEILNILNNQIAQLPNDPLFAAESVAIKTSKHLLSKFFTE